MSLKLFEESHFANSARELEIDVSSNSIEILDDESLSRFWEHNFNNNGKKGEYPTISGCSLHHDPIYAIGQRRLHLGSIALYAMNWPASVRGLWKQKYAFLGELK